MNPTARIRPFRWLSVLALIVSALFSLLSGAQASQSITLAWDASNDSQVTGYRLYYGTNSGVYTQTVDASNLTSVAISFAGGNTYYAAVTSYNAAGTESLPSNEIVFSVAPDSVPVVNLASLGSTVNGPTTLTLSASASDANASITRVEFYAGSTRIGVASTAPYNVVWNNAQPGNYNLSAVAYDSSGASAISPVVPLTIVRFNATSLQSDSTGNSQFIVNGAPGSTCSVYASEDLVNWRLMQTVVNSTGTLTISDDTAYQVPRRFYKVASY